MSQPPTPIPCQQLVELVTDYLEGTLPPDQRASVEAHLGCCGQCGTYVEQMRMTLRVVGHLGPDDLDPSVEQALLAAYREWKAGSE